jgi:Xaa-Pro dipeptidase
MGASAHMGPMCNAFPMHHKHVDGDGTPEFSAAGNELHHMVLGPGERAVSEWTRAGLRLPDLESIRSYRVSRIQEQLRTRGYDGILVMDPLNIRYMTDTTNMQIWVMHNAARYAFMTADGFISLWDYENCEFLSGHYKRIDEVRRAISSTYFLAGPRFHEVAQRWADDLAGFISDHCGPNPRIAVDQVNFLEGKMLEEHGITVERGQEVMERARLIKSADELDAMRCAAHACTSTMADIREQVEPGMTETHVWSMLHAGNIRRGGEWIETQILASGPRTNPWFQEASSRVIENGDILAYDTDLVGAYGMCIDISRSWMIGDKRPDATQQQVYDLALEQINRNMELMKPGTTIDELTHRAWTPPVEDYRHYSVLFHGVGLCDEWPSVYFPAAWDDLGQDYALEPGVVMTVEAFVGSRAGGQGVKLEEQVVITETGCELVADYPLSL